jgi:Tol biopolymer transport system component
MPAHQITDLRGNNVSPKWSPNGRSIVFVSDRSDHSFVTVYDIGADSVRYISPYGSIGTFRRDGLRMAVRSPSCASLAFNPKTPLIPKKLVQWSIVVADASKGTGREIWHSSDQPNDSFS